MNTLKIAPLIVICIAVFLASLFPMASLAEEDETPCIKWVLVGEPAVNPNNELTEYRGGGYTPNWYTSAAYDGKFNLFEVSETRFYEHEREWFRGLLWDVKFNCDFDAPPKELIPGESYELTVDFTHEVLEFNESPRAYQQFNYHTGGTGIGLVLPEGMYAGNQFLYSPWHPDFTGENSKTWTLNVIKKGAPFYPAPGATWTLTAQWRGMACCNVTWTYEAQEIPCDTQVPTPETAACEWTGTWDTSWGMMELVQTGNQVTGTYGYQDGRITGSVNGNMLTGTWSEAPSHSPPNDAGDFEFTMSSDCNSFTGRWRYDSTGNWDTGWTGTRVGEPTSIPQPTTCDIVGEWKWFSGTTVRIYDEGTFTEYRGSGTTGLTGSWRATGSMTYELVWSHGYTDNLTISADCQRLDGKNQEGTTVWGTRIGDDAPTPTSIPQLGICDVVGEWQWFNGGTVYISGDGTFEARGSDGTQASGTWRVTGSMTYELTWDQGYVDSLTISADCQRLDGKNQGGVTVSGTRISGEVPPPTGSPTPITGIPTSSPTDTMPEIPPSLVVDSRTVIPGATVTVPVRLVNVRDVGSLNYDITYDSSVINIARVDKGSLLSGISFVVNPNETGIIQFGFATEDGVSGTGPIGQIVCNAVGSAGSSTRLTISAIEATDSAGNPITLQTFSGSVTIASDRVVGDSNGDGVLTELDALAALRMSVNLMEEDLILDMDKDGRVTAKDALAILSIAVRGR